ncbi:MAG: hypothetical protein HY671_12205 [Chloroflexi bacterium]|nr:hypothetical protein [Chloroflexota bacterium]
MANKGAGGNTTLAILAVILMLVGLTFLFRNFHLLPWGLWGTLWRLWPVLLVVLGIYLVLGRSRPGLAVALTIVAVAAAFVISWAWGQRSLSGSFTQPLGNLEKADVSIEFGAGEMSLDSLPPTSPDLVRGEFEHQGITDAIDHKLTVDGRAGQLDIAGPPSRARFLGDFRQNWQIKLTPRIPLDLAIKAGASNGKLNLTDLRISRLRLDIGASKATLNLPRAVQGTLDAQIKAGAADLNIVIPPGVAAQIRPDDGLSALKVDDKRFLKTEDGYASPGYAEAGNKIRLRISSGLAKIEVR